MKLLSALKTPVLYVNPPLNPDPGLIVEVFRAGGLGIIDHVTAGEAPFRVSSDTPHGVRILVKDLDRFSSEPGVSVALIALDDFEAVGKLQEGAFSGASVPVVVEVAGADHAKTAAAVGASAVIARGNEGPGLVSQTTGLVLLQELLRQTDMPVFLQGGIDFRTAAGAMAAGAAGVVLDVHLLLTQGSGVAPDMKTFLSSLSMPASTVLGEITGSLVRVYSRVGTKIVRELSKIEESLAPDNLASYSERLRAALKSPCSPPDSSEGLLPLSEDIIAAKKFAKDFHSAEAVINEFGKRFSLVVSSWPFTSDSKVCKEHGTEFPVVQGPMAHVSDNPDFLAAVAQGGALPFLAMGNMPPPIAREGLALAREKTGGKFGVGLIGLEINRKTYEAHLAIMKDNPPPFAVLAAGGVDLAKLIEEMGTRCYLHCPSPAILAEALKAGLRNFVFEGCESGGHIGNLGSLNLWAANLNELQSAAERGIQLSDVTVLFAGGIASGAAAAFVAGMSADLTAKGLNVGLQMGTAYLATEEAVNTCAITRTYQDLTLESRQTVVIGRTVNIRARAARCAMAAQLIESEQERLRNGVPLTERKVLYEKDNLGSLRLAAKGCAIDPETATWDCPVFCDLAPDEQLNRGLYLMGQVVSVLEDKRTIKELHAEIVEGGRRVFESKALPANSDEVVEITDGPLPVIEVEDEREPIAIVGIGLRFPGSDTPAKFWDQIINGRSGIVEVPPERWGKPELYYDPDPKAPDKTYSRIGGFLRDFKFDPLKYRIPPSVAKQMDLTQQMAVACVGDALEDAGLSVEMLKGRRVGIIIGNSMGGEKTDRYAERVHFSRVLDCLEQAFSALNVQLAGKGDLLDDFKARYLGALPDITEDSLPGELANVISGRIANVFNLAGPNFTVDAACASSIAAVMNAVSALRNGSIDFALTGGVDAAMHPSSFVKFCKVGALSPDGSRPFDVGANGFVMGEGVGIMVLKRLSDAVRDRDRIYGTILSIGSSSDGRGKGITAPNAAGQERALRACMELGKIDPRTIGLLEAHGTSTAVGDATELKVLDQFFRAAGRPSGSLGVGSVKSQIGHLKAAAGSAGIIKAVLSLYNRTLPPTINIKEPNPCIDWESTPLSLLTEPRPWDSDGSSPRRAGVSAFGFGGTNFHIVLQEHVPGLKVVSLQRERIEAVPIPDWPQLPNMDIRGDAWIVGADDPSDLSEKINALIKDLNEENVQRHLRRHREEAETCELRCGFAAHDLDTCMKKLQLIQEGLADPAKRSFFPARGIHVSQGRRDKSRLGIAFLFPGQGSQYPYMLRDLAERFPVIAEVFREADEILTSLGLPSVTSTVFPAAGESTSAKELGDAMKDTQLLQPMILTANTAILRLLARMGVTPSAVAGHSLGEYAACVAAGVFSFRDALEAVAVRGREMARVSIADPGLMMSIPADARVVEDVLAEVDGYVVAANKNSPKQTVISGETEAVKKAGELFKARGLEGMLIPVSAAFHSGVVAPAREPFMRTLERLTLKPPTLPILSNVTGDFYPVGPGAADRIRDLLGKQFAAPVEWVKTLRRLHAEGIRIFLECGPKRVMTNLTIDTLPADVVAVPTNHPKKGGIGQLMEALAALAAEGVAVNFDEAEKPQVSASKPRRERPELKLVTQTVPETAPVAPAGSQLLQGLLDEEIRDIASQKEFSRYLEFQGESIRALIKTGYKSFVENVLPLDKTVKTLRSEGMDFQPVVVSGISAGLPSDVRFPFDRDTLDDLIMGRNFIKKVSDGDRRLMLDKNVERLFKGPSGEAELSVVEDINGVIQLAGFFSEEKTIDEYGLDERLVRAMDVTTRLAVCAGIEALKDAGIPLVRQIRTTSTGVELPEAWALPPELRDETGIIFASAFPGMASLVDEVTRETSSRFGSGASKRLIEFYSGLIQHISDDRERDRITKWFTQEFSRVNPVDSEEQLYTFNRDFLLRVMSMGHGQLAQLIKAQGPNTHIDAACAGTTQAVVLARDWIRTGQAKRVIVIAADDVAGRSLFPWIGSGFLAMGAATTTGNVSEAALPFDDRRHGLILGSAAAGLVLESMDLVKKRGMDPIAAVEAGIAANSGFHGTRLDVGHISSVMGKMISKWEQQSGRSRNELANDMFFMSHETYSPKRGGSSAAEIQALRENFGENARKIPIANTKGFTGHTMGVGVEDVVALRCLQTQMVPPIPNLKHPDPEFADLNLSKGGKCSANYALRLAAGFGSQIVMALYRSLSREENRITDLHSHRAWLKTITGYSDPVISVEDRTLRVSERSAVTIVAKEAKNAEPAAPAEIPVAARPSAVSVGGEEIRQKILFLLSEKTGYPPDMLDTGLDLEADLGIDTVKQAEFISEVREAFDIPRIEGLKIAEFPTIEHIINFVRDHTQKDETGSAFNEATAGNGVDKEAVQGKILSLLSAKTGYPADMLDTSLDLEADLGIDTVKQAEFISEVREAFDIPRIDGLKIADFPTIDHIIGFVMEKTRSQTAPAAPVSDEKPAEDYVGPEEEIRLFETSLVSVGNPQSISLPNADEVLVLGGPEQLSQRIADSLSTLGYGSVKTILGPLSQQEVNAKKIGVVNLQALNPEPKSLTETFQLFLDCATTFENGPAFFVSVVSEDGAFGFDHPSETGHVAGAVAGATKSFAREYPDTLVRLLDVHPNLSPADTATVIQRSLTEAFPVETAVGKSMELRSVRLVPSVESSENTGIKTGEVILVSGGAKGITAECLRRLAEQNPLTVIILSRTEISSRAEKLAKFTAEQWEQEKTRVLERMRRSGSPVKPVMVEREMAALKGEAEAFRTISDLRAAGSEVIYRGLDIRDGKAVDAAIHNVAETCGRVDVVIHAAGIDNSRALKSKTLEQIEAVIAVKLQGMQNILNSLEKHEMPPRRIIGFGSVAGRFGNLAQLDYSAANDGLAHLLRKCDRDLDAKASIIDWAPWADVGMATRGSVQKTLEAAGIDFIPPRQGVDMLLRELGRSTQACEVLVGGRLGPFAADAFQIAPTDLPERVSFAGEETTILSLLPGEYLRARVSLNPANPLLDHHRINRAAVLPGVGAMEIMRAAATVLDPEAINAVFEDVRFRGPIKVFKEDPFEAEVEVRRIQDSDGTSSSYHARIVSWFMDREGRKVGAPRLHHECKLRPMPVSGAHSIDVEMWRESIWVPSEDIYAVFFHGPAFMLLEHLLLQGDGEGIRFRYRDTPEMDSMFANRVPAIMEAVFQTGAGFGLEHKGIMALPTGIDRVTVFSGGSEPRDGELRPTRVTQDGPDGRNVFRFDGFVRDTAGRVIIELQGIQMVELEGLARFPGRVFEQMLPVAEISEAMETSREEVVNNLLHEEEAQELVKKATPKRAAEWLAGRAALKRIVRRVASISGEEPPAERQIRIVQDDNGKPMAEIVGMPGRKVSDLSLSHSNGLAMAAAAVPGTFTGIGVDLEKIEARSDSWVHDYFTDEEIRSAGAGDTRWLELTKRWCLKEAALKAMGTGLRFDLKDINVAGVNKSGNATLEFRNDAFQCFKDNCSGKVIAKVERQDHLVLARVLLR